jgi:signal transduction histidine kinase
LLKIPDDVALLSSIATVAQLDVVPTILEVVCRSTGMGFAAVARVTEDRWIACSVKDDIAFGLKAFGELPVETTICNEIRGHGEAVAINDVATDETYCGHPTPARYGFRSYISVPIVLEDGKFFGTLCAIDPNPANVKEPSVLGMFKAFAQLIAFQIHSQNRLDVAEADLSTARETADLREQFIAVLGHDLRNPLAAIMAGTTLLQRSPEPQTVLRTTALMQNSVKRMAGLIDMVVDFARTRMGGGMGVQRSPNCSVEDVLRQVVNELQVAAPDRAIEVHMAIDEPISCDGGRIGQLASNLVSNALTHGGRGAPIRVRASTTRGVLELSVANGGDPIPREMLGKLFLPFVRASARSSQQGLGLGLYIASEIARAHGGALTVASDLDETRFTLRMPCQPLA